MKGKQVFISGEGVAVLEKCRDKLETRDSMKWSNARVVQWALVTLLDKIDFAKAEQTKETR